MVAGGRLSPAALRFLCCSYGARTQQRLGILSPSFRPHFSTLSLSSSPGNWRYKLITCFRLLYFSALLIVRWEELQFSIFCIVLLERCDQLWSVFCVKEFKTLSRDLWMIVSFPRVSNLHIWRLPHCFCWRFFYCINCATMWLLASCWCERSRVLID